MDIIEKGLQSRLESTKFEKIIPEKKEYIKIRFSHPAMDRTAMSSILHDNDIISACPDKARLSSAMVSFSQGPPIHCAIQNVTEVSKTLENYTLPEVDECPCKKYIGNHQHHEGHLFGVAQTMNNVSEKFRALALKGRYYRLSGNIQEAQEVTSDAFEAYATSFDGSDDEVTNFTRLIREKINKAFATLPPASDCEIINKKELTDIQQDVVFTSVDKSKQDFGVVCKRQYLHALQDQLKASKQFAPCTLTMEEVKQKMTNFAIKHEVKVHQSLQYLYGSVKLHKPKEKGQTYRWIAGTSNPGQRDNNASQTDKKVKKEEKKKDPVEGNIATGLHTECSGILKKIMETLRDEDNGTYARTGIRKYFVVENIDSVMMKIKNNYSQLKKLTPTTRDFTAMYTSLNQDDLIKGVMWCVERVFALKAGKTLARETAEKNRKKKTFHWKVGTQGKFLHYDPKKIEGLVTDMVKNCYVMNGDEVMHQVTGIPTGGNSCQDLANCFCVSREIPYIESLPKSMQLQFEFYSRYIDDAMPLGPDIPDETYGITSENTTDAPDNITFIGGRFRWQRYNDNDKSTYIRTSVYHKESEWENFQPIKYTARTSAAPLSQGKGILTSQFRRCMLICNNLQDAIQDSTYILWHLLSRGYTQNDLRGTWTREVKNFYTHDPKGKVQMLRVFEHAAYLVTNNQEIPQEPPYVGRRPYNTTGPDQRHSTHTVPIRDKAFFVTPPTTIDNACQTPAAEVPKVPPPPPTPPPPPPYQTSHGIHNPHNLCYMIAPLQAIRDGYLPELVSSVKGKMPANCNMLQQCETLVREQTKFNISTFQRTLPEHFHGSNQQCVDEFITTGLIPTLTAELQRTSSLFKIPELHSKVSTTCSACKSITTTMEPTNVLRIHIHDIVAKSFPECVHDVIHNKTTLQGVNMFECTPCDTHTVATQSREVTSLPMYLPIYVKRFTGALVKLHDRIEVGTSMSHHIGDTLYEYEASGAIMHYGTFHGGHYTYVKQNETTVTVMDDNLVTEEPGSITDDKYKDKITWIFYKMSNVVESTLQIMKKLSEAQNITSNQSTEIEKLNEKLATQSIELEKNEREASKADTTAKSISSLETTCDMQRKRISALCEDVKRITEEEVTASLKYRQAALSHEESQKTIAVLQAKVQKMSQQKVVKRPKPKTSLPEPQQQNLENAALAQAQLLDLQDQKDALATSSKNYEDKNQQLTHEITTLRSQYSQLVDDVSEKEITIKSQKDSLLTSQNTLQQGAAAYEQLKSYQERLTRQYAEEIQSLKLRNDQLTIEAQSEHAIAKERQHELEKSREEQMHASKQLALTSESFSELSKRHETATALLAETHEKLANGEAAYNSATFRLKEAEHAINNGTLQLTASQRQLEEATREKDSVIAINENMVYQHSRLQQAHENLYKEGQVIVSQHNNNAANRDNEVLQLRTMVNQFQAVFHGVGVGIGQSYYQQRQQEHHVGPYVEEMPDETPAASQPSPAQIENAPHYTQSAPAHTGSELILFQTSAGAPPHNDHTSPQS